MKWERTSLFLPLPFGVTYLTCLILPTALYTYFTASFLLQYVLLVMRVIFNEVTLTVCLWSRWQVPHAAEWRASGSQRRGRRRLLHL